jgi:hypothetical protein
MDHATASTYGLPRAVLRDDESVFGQISKSENLTHTIRDSILWSMAAAAVFGATLGAYGHSAAQILSSAIKVPLLLVGSAALCFPTFHVLQVLRAPKALSLKQSVALHTTSLSAIALIWAAFSLPLFFLVGTTQHYTLAQFLALAVGGAGGVVGLVRLLAGYRKLCHQENEKPRTKVLLLYFAIHSLVGAQLAWVLRPFIGSPTLGFQLFRDLEGNIFGHMLNMIGG